MARRWWWTVAAPDGKTLNDPSTGRFTKGHTKRGGRAPGTVNKVTAATRLLLEDAVLYGLKRVKRDLDKMKAPTRQRAVARLLEYVQPKLARVEQTGPDGGPVIIEKRVVEVRVMKEKS